MSIRVIAILGTAALAGALRGDTLIDALEYYRRGNCKEAKPLFEKVLARQPKNATVQRLLASCEAPAPKKTVARAARKTPPPDPKPAPSASEPIAVPPVAPPPTERELAGAAFNDAEIHIKAKRLQEAERLLTQVVEQKPLLALPRIRLAEIYSGTRRFREAAKQYAELSRLPDASPEFKLRAAQNLTWAKELADSVALYEAYLAERPNDATARLGLANVLFWQDRLAEAAKAYRRYLDLKPDDADANLNRGRALLWTEQYADALPALVKARQLQKSTRDAMLDLAIAECYEHLQKPKEALLAFEQALEKAPGTKEAAEGRERLTKQILLRDAYDRQEKGDYATAAKGFLAYLDKNPDDDAVLLQVARLHSWNKDGDKAIGYYNAYVGKQPKDLDALRELARIHIAQPDFAAARKTYGVIVESGKATADDYAGLVNAHVWDGHYDAAQPFIDKLIEIDPTHEVARDARTVLVGKARTQELERARLLASTGKFSDALQTYRKFVQKFGADREIELAVARLFAWDNQPGKAMQAYQEYLHRYGQDTGARLELADLARWNGKPRLAEAEYRRILKADPANTAARFGLTQISDQRGDDRFVVFNSYRDVLGLDPSHRASRERLGDLAPRVSPSLHYRQSAFRDSDSFSRSLNTIEAAFPMPGGLRIAPLARYGYFNQFRQIGGGDCNAAPSSLLQSAGVAELSQEICDSRGSMRAFGGGVRLDLSPREGYLFTVEAANMQLGGPRARWSPMLSAELVMSPRPRTRVTLAFRHRDGIFDLNTISSLYAGVVGTTAEAGFEVPVNDRWSFWISGGAARFSAGRTQGFERNLQKRVAARMNYQIAPWVTAGYYIRASNFQRFSPLYFSPDFYGTMGMGWTWDKQISKTFSFVGDLEIGYGRINRYDTAGVYNMELSLYPAFIWRVRPDLALQMGYRFGRGRSSAFGSPVYSTGGLDLRLSNFFVPNMPRPNPNRIEIR